MENKKIREFDDLLNLEMFYELLNFPSKIVKDEFTTTSTLLKNWGKALIYAIEEEITDDNYYYTTIENLKETSIYDNNKGISNLINDMILNEFLIYDCNKYYFNIDILDIKKLLKEEKEFVKLEEEKQIFYFAKDEWFIREEDEIYEICTKSVFFNEDNENQEHIVIGSACKFSEGEDIKSLNKIIQSELEDIIKVPRTINMLKLLYEETVKLELYSSALIIKDELKRTDAKQLKAIEISSNEEYDKYFKDRKKSYANTLKLLDCSEITNTYGYFEIVDDYCSILDIINNDINFEEIFWYISMILNHERLSQALYEVATDLNINNPLRKEIMIFLGEEE